MRDCARDARQAGITLPELLVVVAIIGMAVMVAIPVISRTVQGAKIRAATQQFAVTVRAVRMIAVTVRGPVDLAVEVDPVNAYEYMDVSGVLRRFELDSAVRIASSDTPITFNPDGSLENAATTRLEIGRPGEDERAFVVRTNRMGVPQVEEVVP